MRKFLLIIFLFLSCMNVFASERSFRGSEYIENVFYVKNSGSVTQYRRAQVIRDTVTGEIAYCIEPFSLLVNDSYYDEDTAYNSIYGISKGGELDSFSILHMSANLCEMTCEENADYYEY